MPKHDLKDVRDAHLLMMEFRRLKIEAELTPYQRQIIAEELARPENQDPQAD